MGGRRHFDGSEQTKGQSSCDIKWTANQCDRSPNIPASTGMLLPFHAGCISRFFLVPNLSLSIFLTKSSASTLTPEYIKFLWGAQQCNTDLPTSSQLMATDQALESQKNLNQVNNGFSVQRFILLLCDPNTWYLIKARCGLGATKRTRHKTQTPILTLAT